MTIINFKIHKLYPAHEINLIWLLNGPLLITICMFSIGRAVVGRRAVARGLYGGVCIRFTGVRSVNVPYLCIPSFM